jgi:hypothetical protein
MSSSTATVDWTCTKCEVTASWMPGHEQEQPADWVKQNGDLLCLSCRRDSAAEAGLEAAGETTVAARAQVRKRALLEFEIQRDPDRPNGEIAKAASCSQVAVQKAREELGV